VYGSAAIANDYAKWGIGSGQFSYPPGSGGYTGHAVAFDDPSLAPGTGDFTIECWVYVPTSPPTIDTVLQVPFFSPGQGGCIRGSVVNSTSYTLCWRKYVAGSSEFLCETAAISTNAWHHVWLTRESGTIRLAIDGTESATTGTDTTDYVYGTGYKTVVGNHTTNVFPAAETYGFGGRIDDLRYTVGFARPLEVPTGPYPNI
jgi:hypothetical protein